MTQLPSKLHGRATALQSGAHNAILINHKRASLCKEKWKKHTAQEDFAITGALESQ